MHFDRTQCITALIAFHLLIQNSAFSHMFLWCFLKNHTCRAIFHAKISESSSYKNSSDSEEWNCFTMLTVLIRCFHSNAPFQKHSRLSKCNVIPPSRTYISVWCVICFDERFSNRLAPLFRKIETKNPIKSRFAFKGDVPQTNIKWRKIENSIRNKSHRCRSNSVDQDFNFCCSYRHLWSINKH